MFKPRYLWHALLLAVALPIVAHAGPWILAGQLIYALSTAAISAGVSAAAYGIGKLAQSLRGKVKPTESARPEVRVNASAEGSPIRRLYGRFAAAGYVIYQGFPPTWNPGTAGGGKSRTPPTEGYYSTSFGVAVCLNDFNNCLGVSAVYMNEKLVYSVDPGTLSGTNNILIGTVNGPQVVAGGARQFQIILGNEDANDRCLWYEADEGGGSDVPAYRGLVTCWWDDLDQRNYYNAIPQVLVEVVMSDGTYREIIAAEAELAGIDPDTELDVTGVSVGYTVNGMFAEGATPPKQLFEPMDIVNRFRIVEADGILKAFSIPQDSSATVPLADLGAYVGGIEDGVERVPQSNLELAQHDELPQRIEIGYFNALEAYESASRGYSRQSGGAKGTTQFYLPMAMAADEARFVASKYLTSLYAEGDPWRGVLPPRYSEYHPGDTLTITEPDSTLIDIRIERMIFAPGSAVEVEGIRQLRLTGGGTADDDPHIENPDDNTEQLAVDVAWVQSNCPPLIDDHDGLAGLYFGCVPMEVPSSTQRPWTGATLYQNKCGSDEGEQVYVAIARTVTPATIGKAMSELADGSGLDTTSTVDIFFPYGTGNVAIVGVLDDAFTKTTVVNLCILGKEVLQFKDVLDVSEEYEDHRTVESDFYPEGSGFVYRLSHLKRGLRSTAHQTASHAEDEPFMMWSPDSVIRVPLDIVEHDNTWNFKALSDGQEAADRDPLTFTIEHDGDTLLKEEDA